MITQPGVAAQHKQHDIGEVKVDTRYSYFYNGLHLVLTLEL
jgi:hypothetical protein